MHELEFLPSWYPTLRQRRRTLRARARRLAALAAALIIVTLAAALKARPAPVPPDAVAPAMPALDAIALSSLVAAAAAASGWIWTRQQIRQLATVPVARGQWIRSRRADPPPARPLNPLPPTQHPPQPDIATLNAIAQAAAIQNFTCRSTDSGGRPGSDSTLHITFSSHLNSLAAFLQALEQTAPAWKVRELRAAAPPSANAMLQVNLTIDFQPHPPRVASAT